MIQDSFQSDHCALMLKALSDPARLKIIDVLRSGAKNVGDIAAAVEMEVVNASHHLGVLKHAGLVENCREGRFIIYRLTEGVLQKDSHGETSPQINLGCCQLVVPLAKK